MKTTLALLIATLTFLATFTLAEEKLKIAVSDKIEVSTDSLRLGDIANLPEGHPLADLALGYAPEAGLYRWLERSEVERQLRRAGASQIELQMATRVLVTRRSKLLSEAEIREAVALFLADFWPDVDAQITRLDLPRSMVVPDGEVGLEVSAPETHRRTSNLSLKLEISVDGRAVRSQWIRIGLRLVQPVVVAAGTIPPGQRIREADLTLQQQEVTDPDRLFQNIAEVVGQQAPVGVRAGQALTRNSVQAPTLVRRGDRVKIALRGAGFRLSSVGKARRNGRLGEQIEIENIESRKVVLAQVVGEGSVEVVVP